MVTGMSIRERLRDLAPGMLIVIALGLFWTFGYNGIWQRLQIDLDGKVTARQDYPQTRYTHGPQTVYTLQRSDGSIGEYTATRNDPSLPRTIPIGASVTKKKWELSYLLNGQRVDDFPIFAYVAFLVVGVVSLIATSIWLARERLR
jgi:hypothetical protein